MRYWLAGVSDYWEGRHDITAALAAVPAGEPVIAFTHNPDIFPGVQDRVSLTLAGHTHGGQVDLPLVGPPIVPSKFGQRYASGHIVEGGRHLFVGTGTGTSILPVRFRVPPEIRVLVLRSSHHAEVGQMKYRALQLAAVALVVLTTTGCSVLAQIAGESVGVPLESKLIAAKSPPNTLIADDQSTCTVTRGRWEEAEVGDRHLCAWSGQRGL